MARRRLIARLPTPAKAAVVLGALYLFLVGIGAMGAAFKLMGRSYTEELLGVAAGPVVSLFIGIFATTLVQSSSTTTSLTVALVAAGGIDFHSAIYMVMGANVGTTVTNTIVSLGHITRSSEYERAFAAATVHDFFNLLVLLVLFPLEVFTGFLDTCAKGATDAFQGIGGTKLADPIKIVTKPAIELLHDIAAGLGGGGWLLLALALGLTFGMLVLLVKGLRAIMITRLENLFDRVLFRNPPVALLFGLVLTALVQSSSVTTSLAVPLVGAGILSIRQIFPYTMGANIGTTLTALIASLAALAAAQTLGGNGDGDSMRKAMLGVQLAFHHVLFNVAGVALLWPFREVPIRLARAFARLALRNRLIPLVYIVITFYLAPLLVIWLGT